jgi:hypothetical protein
MSTSQPPGGAPGQDPNRGSSSFGRRIEEAVGLIEVELRLAIAYMNDAVVPQVRRESITAMRNLSDTLKKLADRFEAAGHPSSNPEGKDNRP